MKLIVGLGNPGKKFKNTRHNAGREITMALCPSKFQPSLLYKALLAEAFLNEEKYSFLLPETYMNLSGISVASFVRDHPLAPEDILVIHDEIDLPPGEVRFKKGGGHNGHNGLKDIIEKLGHSNFCRLRIGVGRPASKWEVADYVLSPVNFAWPLSKVKEVLRQNHWADFS
ncbi:MAG: aminoacyl-tRNA hydrolase [Leptospiraceae bacterium]|nr:aminoacyl-tRNA hydrolase [Leptospiraceae bacterium]MDW8307255.1 aminoacyl-tRNA hydrolase [Leptospiraceae bacterium]